MADSFCMHLSEINIYPVKSLAGISLTEAVVEDRGLRFDRRWMLVDENNGHITQREYPLMATIGIVINNSHLSASFNGSSLEIPLKPDGDIFADVTIWDSAVRAKVYDVETNVWFSDVLQTTCRLVLMLVDIKRNVNPAYAIREEDEVSFADGYPFLLIGEGSLADLNSRLEKPLPMNRFRPNLVVAGSEAFAEDTWKRIMIGETEFHVVKPCERCVITTVDQSRGEKDGKEPLKTLATYRNQNGKVLFGQNLIAEKADGKVCVGDEVKVIERR